MPMKGYPLTGLQLNHPNSRHVRFQKQFSPHTTIGIGSFAFLNQFGWPALKVFSGDFGVNVGLIHNFMLSEKQQARRGTISAPLTDHSPPRRLLLPSCCRSLTPLIYSIEYLPVFGLSIVFLKRL